MIIEQNMVNQVVIRKHLATKINLLVFKYFNATNLNNNLIVIILFNPINITPLLQRGC